MAIEKIGINFTNWGNMTSPSFTVPTTSKGWIDRAITVTHELTYGFFGLISMSISFLILFYLLTDVSYTGEFRFSRIRGAGIAAAMVSIIGIFMLSFGWFTSIYHVVVFMTITMVATIWCFLDKRN